MVDRFLTYKSWSGQPDNNKPQGKKMNPEMNEKELQQEVMNMFTGTDTQVIGVKPNSGDMVDITAGAAGAVARTAKASEINPFADNSVADPMPATDPISVAIETRTKVKVIKTDS